MKIKQEKGITLMALVITIIVLLILAGIGLTTGGNTIKNTQLENLKTNMLLIKAKAKGYVESANYDLGTNIDTAQESIRTEREAKAKSELVGQEITDTSILTKMNISQEEIDQAGTKRIYYYQLSTQNLSDMGLNQVKSEEPEGIYVVKYDVNEIQVEIYHTLGFEKNNQKVYSLTELTQ